MLKDWYDYYFPYLGFLPVPEELYDPLELDRKYQWDAFAFRWMTFVFVFFMKGR